MTQLRQRMLSDLQLKGMSERSQQIYIRRVRMLAEYFNKSTDLLTLNDIRNYFLYLKNVKKYSRTALKISYYGLRFFYTVTLNWDVNSFNFFKLPREKKLPVVLNKKEVRKILSLIRLQCYRTCLTLIYTCGLRLQEAINIKVGDIDSERMVIHIKKSKGNYHRYVPLPMATLNLMREYWKTHRNPEVKISFMSIASRSPTLFALLESDLTFYLLPSFLHKNSNKKDISLIKIWGS